MADHIWGYDVSHYPLWDKAKIIEGEHQWKVKKLKETVYIGLQASCASHASVDFNFNTVWFPLLRMYKLESSVLHEWL